MSDLNAEYVAREYPYGFGVLAITFGAFLGAWAGTLNWEDLHGTQYLYFVLFIITLAGYLLNMSSSLLKFGGHKNIWLSTSQLILNLVLMIWMSSLVSEYWHVFAGLVIVWTAMAYGYRTLLRLAR